MTGLLLACLMAAQPAVWLPIIVTQPVQTWVYECGYDAYNCSDFDSWVEAQGVFEYCTAQGGGDVHRLDADSDSIACESLP